MGGGGGSIGKAVAADTRDPRVKSYHQQNFMRYNQNIEKDENKEKETGKHVAH